MKTFLRLLIETFKSLISLILGISVLSMICFLFMYPQTINMSPSPSGPVQEFLFYIQGNLGTGLQLLLVATPIWIIAWLPLRLKQVDSASPWRISSTIFVAAAVGAVGGIIEGAALVCWGYITTGQEEPTIVYMIFSVFGCIIGGLGGALIGAAEILTSRWFIRHSGDSSRKKPVLKFLLAMLSVRGFVVLVISVLAVMSYISFLHSIKRNYAHQLKLDKRDAENLRDAGKLFHFKEGPQVTIPYIVLSPCPPISWIEYVREGTAVTKLLYEKGNGGLVKDTGLQIKGASSSTPFVPGVVSTIPITVAGRDVGSMPGTGLYAEVKERRSEVISEVHLGNINPFEPDRGYIVRSEYPVAVVRYSYETPGGQVVLIASTPIAAYAANGWRTDPLLGGGPREPIVYAPFPP